MLEARPDGCVLQVRYELAMLAFFGFFNVYAMRVNLSVRHVAGWWCFWAGG